MSGETKKSNRFRKNIVTIQNPIRKKAILYGSE